MDLGRARAVAGFADRRGRNSAEGNLESILLPAPDDSTRRGSCVGSRASDRRFALRAVRQRRRSRARTVRVRYPSGWHGRRSISRRIFARAATQSRRWCAFTECRDRGGVPRRRVSCSVSDRSRLKSPAIGVISDASWKGRAAPYRQDVVRGAALPVPPTEILDGAAVPAGWNDAEFDDADWQPAVELSAGTFSYNRTRIPVEPFTSPEHDEIAPLTSIPIALKELSRRGVAALDQRRSARRVSNNRPVR